MAVVAATVDNVGN